MIGIFGDQDLGHGRLCWDAALDQSRRRGRLHDRFLAGSAGVFGSADNKNPELRRNDVKPLAHILADPMQLVLAAGTGLVLDIDHRLDPRQMRRQRSSVRSTLGGARAARLRRRVFFFGLTRGLDLLGLFQPKQQLILRQRLGSSAKAMALEFSNDLKKPFVLHALSEQHRLQRVRIVGKRFGHRRHV
jgi:hypothetical protein